MATWAMAVGPSGPAAWRSGLPEVVPLAVMLAGAAMVLAALWVSAARSRSRTVLALAGVVTLACLGVGARGAYKIVRWDATIWIWDHLLRPREALDRSRPLDVCFCFADHFEPERAARGASQPSDQQQLARVRGWEEAYRRAIAGHADSDGRPPRHTWFFPIAISSPQVRSVMAAWPGMGWGEIEYHLHHPVEFNDQQVREQIIADLEQLRRMGAVTAGYGFVHGMYGLAGGNRACRAYNEIDALLETGCYADFTFPAIGTLAQPSQANSIFYARSTGRPKPYDRGIPAEVGKTSSGLLIIPGPLWAGWPWLTMDDADLTADQPPDPRRVEGWLAVHVHVKGRPNWVFITVHSHTAPEQAREAMFGGAMQKTWRVLEERFKKPGRRLHYVTTREVYNIIKAAEAGRDGNPNDYRDFVIGPPENARAGGTGPQTGSLPE